MIHLMTHDYSERINQCSEIRMTHRSVESPKSHFERKNRFLRNSRLRNFREKWNLFGIEHLKMNQIRTLDGLSDSQSEKRTNQNQERFDPVRIQLRNEVYNRIFEN